MDFYWLLILWIVSSVVVDIEKMLRETTRYFFRIAYHIHQLYIIKYS